MGKPQEKLFTLDDLSRAYVNGFYEAAGSELYYKDFDCDLFDDPLTMGLKPDAYVHSYLNEYIKEVKTVGYG